MNKQETEQLVGQVMSGFLLALVASCEIDKTKLAEALSAFATHPDYTPETANILNHLAQGATALTKDSPTQH